MKAPDILKAAAGHMEDRAATYDKPEGERSMAATVKAFNAVTGNGLMNTEERGWLFMELLKAVRSEQGGYRADNYEDGTAYCSLKGEAAYRERANTERHLMTPNFVERFNGMTSAEFDEVRSDIIGQNGNDGEHYAEDMNDPANWRAGDLVECVDCLPDTLLVIGKVYPINKINIDGVYIQFDPKTSGQYPPSRFRFHSRPSTGWIEWNGGECPCDELSYVEIERRNGFKIQSGAGSFDWLHKNAPSDIMRYRML